MAVSYSQDYRQKGKYSGRYRNEPDTAGSALAILDLQVGVMWFQDQAIDMAGELECTLSDLGLPASGLIRPIATQSGFPGSVPQQKGLQLGCGRIEGSDRTPEPATPGNEHSVHLEQRTGTMRDREGRLCSTSFARRSPALTAAIPPTIITNAKCNIAKSSHAARSSGAFERDLASWTAPAELALVTLVGEEPAPWVQFFGPRQ